MAITDKDKLPEKAPEAAKDALNRTSLTAERPLMSSTRAHADKLELNTPGASDERAAPPGILLVTDEPPPSWTPPRDERELPMTVAKSSSPCQKQNYPIWHTRRAK